MEITLAHGSGGAATGELIRTVFAKLLTIPFCAKWTTAPWCPAAGSWLLPQTALWCSPCSSPAATLAAWRCAAPSMTC